MQTLADTGRVLGPLACCNNLPSGPARRRGTWSGTGPLLEQNVADELRVLGPGRHPDTLISRNNLAHAALTDNQPDDGPDGLEPS